MRGLGVEPYMDVSRRNEILLQIASARSKEARVMEVLAELPAWVDQPFKADQALFNENLGLYQTSTPIVRNLESRLAMEPGPFWRELTAQEQAGLTTWIKSTDQLYIFVNEYFPSETQKYIAQAALWVIAVGSFIAPLFLEDSDKGLSLPFRLEPPVFPQSPPRRQSGGVRPTPPGASPSFSPSSFSMIPAAANRIPGQTAVMRPTTSTPPWRKPDSPSAPRLPQSTPGFRTFAKPLGPETPATRIQTPAEVATGTSTPLPPRSPHGAPIYPNPRFRRQ